MPVADSLPLELADVYHGLWEDVAQVHIDWNRFKDLYPDPATIALLNRSAPYFFGAFQHQLLDGILLAITRITDHAGKGRRKNLSIELLLERIPAADLELRRSLDALAIRARDEANFARRHRDKRIAHADLRTRLSRAKHLPPKTRDAIERVLVTLAELMNTIQGYYQKNAQTFYKGGIEPLGDVASLLDRLRSADRRRQQDDEELE